MSTLNGGPGNIVTNGLVLYLDAANYLSYTSGSTVWRDLSSSNLSGSLINGPTFNSGNGGSIVFDGINDWIDLGTPSPLTALFGTSKLSLSTWIYLTTNISSQKIIFDSGVNEHIQIDIQNNQISVLINSGVYTRSNRTSTLSLNTWYNFTGTYNGSNIITYLNSVTTTPVTASGNIPVDTGGFALGKYPLDFRYNYTGNIASFQIYNRALSAQEVLQNYNAQKTRFGLT